MGRSWKSLRRCNLIWVLEECRNLTGSEDGKGSPGRVDSLGKERDGGNTK